MLKQMDIKPRASPTQRTQATPPNSSFRAWPGIWPKGMQSQSYVDAPMFSNARTLTPRS